VGSKIDYGNHMLGLDVVARDENSVPITPKKAGVMHLHKVVGFQDLLLGMVWLFVFFVFFFLFVR